MSNAGAVAPTVPAARQLQLNPERVPALIAKWQKLLGKDLDRIEVTYNADGVDVSIYPLVGKPGFRADGGGNATAISVAAFKAAKQASEAPSEEEAKRAFRNKFELRLNIPFPSDGDLGSGDEAGIQAFIEGRPFNERRALLMSNKQFSTAYPNGFGQARA